MLDSSSLAGLLGTTGAAKSDTAASLLSAGLNMKGMDADKTSKDFESMFLAQMMESMFGDSSGDEAFGSEETNEVYKGMMMDQYGKQISAAGGIGIASYVKQELLKLQEK